MAPGREDDEAPRSACPVQGEARRAAYQTQQRGASPDGCPASRGAPPSPDPVYNVYGEKIDPANQMAANPNQKPIPGQTQPLSTERVQSGIPKGGTDSTWLYPSPQMFFNALNRKGKGDGVNETDIDTVVAIHNNMNERTWRQLMQWEKDKACLTPRLVRFLGRPDELTPKAWIKSKLGYGIPFDRHDWIIDRCGQEVRYVVDFYHDEGGVEKDRIPGLHDTVAVRSIKVDVRPALDSFGSVIDRIRHVFLNTGQVLEPVEDHSCLPENPSDSDVHAIVKARCGSALMRFAKGDNDPAEQSRAAMALNYCMGTLVCKPQADEFMKALETSPPVEGASQRAYDLLLQCLKGQTALQALFADKNVDASSASQQVETSNQTG